ncbi:uncharacterized protein LOC129607777, partial [Condylostylus longicornis]|uniref:uncharacterized protein LOC129607777 n=1 Tax=Condylostylus longicornis TaxID=2530218 RepID=UPI00244E5743
HETLHCQRNGTWDHLPYKCLQTCGAVENANQSHLNWLYTSHNGLRKPFEVPWHINIYSTVNSEKYQHICGGTLIQSNIVISAAHCFWNDEKSLLYDKSKFIITAGKVHRDYYSDKETFDIQRASIFKINIPPNFRGSQNNFEGDIAILTLNNHLKLRSHILPICVPWTTHNGIFDGDNQGLVVGLGDIDSDTNFPLLRTVSMQQRQLARCKKDKLLGNNVIPDDKFCVYPDFRNENICKGDGGGGFVVYDRGYPWFIGVFSNIILPNTSYSSECDDKLIRTFTSMYPYELFMENITLSANNDNESSEIVNDEETIDSALSNLSPGCLVPTNNLVLLDIDTKIHLEPGTVILNKVYVNYSCPVEYLLEGEISNSCTGMRWKKLHPKCIRTCSPIKGNSIRVEYYYKDNRVENQTIFKPGTIARIKCATMYRKPTKYLIHEDVHCQTNGEWDYEPFQCEQICGTIDTNLPFSVNSTLTLPNRVPWNVAIYSKNKQQKYEQKCGGTIIQSKIVITAAHCFWDPSEAIIEDKSKFIITTGKFYRDFYANNEMLEVQKINISKINIPITFYGANYDWANDIAVVTLSDHIEYKSHIRPACLTWKEQSEQYIQSNLAGVVAGWGITDNGTYSPELRSVELLSIDSHTCKTKKITRNDNIASDKFCVETGDGKNVCPGDSGGGFVVPTEVNNKILYNLWGVVSNGIIGRGDLVPQCNSNFITTFTNVQYYRQMISGLIAQA